jgi:uncharacterized membrane protein HdeD (DUF308 family)
MLDVLTGNWWVTLLRGGAALLFGLLVLILPGLTLGVLVALCAGYVLVDGALALWLGLRARGRDRGARFLLFQGAAGVAIGAVALLWSDITAFVLVLLLATWAIATGALQVIVGLALRRAGLTDWLLTGVGTVSLVFGLALFVLSAAGSLAFLFWIALYALGVGALSVLLALRLRALAHGAAGDDGMVATA